MADIRSIQYPGAPNLLSAIQTGANIRGAQERSTLERERHRSNVEQLAVENKRIEDDRAEKSSEREYDKGILEMKSGKSRGRMDRVDSGFRRTMKAIGVDVSEDMPISQETYDEFLKIESTKDPLEHDVGADDFAKEFGLTVEEFAQKAKQGGADVSAFETRQTLEATIGGEERKLEGQKALEEFKTGESIRQKQAEITATSAALKERPPKGKAQTVTLGNLLVEKGKNGVWKKVFTGPEKVTGSKVVDKQIRELNLMSKIEKQAIATISRDPKFTGKPKARWEFRPLSGQYIESTDFPWDEYATAVSQKVEELRQKAEISDEVVASLREGVPSHDPSAIPDIPTAPTAPPDVQQGFVDEGLDQQGFRLGEIETDGDFKGQHQVLDESGNIKGHFKP